MEHHISKRLSTYNDADKQDRLSSLPKDIFMNIISRLPIKSAVTTAVLSHRWRYLWTLTAVLHCDTLTINKTIDKLSTIIDHILPQLNSLQTFILHLHPDEDPDSNNRSLFSRDTAEHYSQLAAFCSHLRSWITHLCTRKVQHVEVVVFGGYCPTGFPATLPACLFNCDSLESLILDLKLCVTMPTKLDLPNLRTLDISNPNLRDGELLNKSCPCLERLSFSGDIDYPVSRRGENPLVISSTKLERLNIDLWNNRYGSALPFEVDAPNLKSFQVADINRSRFEFIKDPNELVAVILGRSFNIRSMGRHEGKFSLELFKGIRNVRVLKLDTITINAFNWVYDEYDDVPLQGFCNLTELVCSKMSTVCWDKMVRLLRCTPKLESLTIEMDSYRCKIFEQLRSDDDANNTTRQCSLHHLKRVEIKTVYYWPKTEEDWNNRIHYWPSIENSLMELIRFILRNSSGGLEKLVLKLHPGSHSIKPLIYDELRHHGMSESCCVDIHAES